MRAEGADVTCDEVGSQRESSEVGTVATGHEVSGLSESTDVGAADAHGDPGGLRSSKVGEHVTSHEVGGLSGSSDVRTVATGHEVSGLSESSELGASEVPDDPGGLRSSEVGAHVTSHGMRGQDLPLTTVPIGRPIANTEIYLLDGGLEAVPVGVVGEVYVGGVGLARGYLKRPELTAERFVADRYGRRAGGRLYRTGDLARYGRDGRIEYVGRADRQVKIRGNRIELGEIESVLSQYPGVREAVVVVREAGGVVREAEKPEERRLVAYCTSRDRTVPSTAELRETLRKKLPEYMVPSAFVVLDELPRTPSGKVDRQRLPAPELGRPEPGSAYVAPRSNVERVLAGIWEQVLGVARVGVHDDFFDLGGDSILNTRIIARALQAGLRLTPRQLFQSPTVARLALVAVAAPAMLPLSPEPAHDPGLAKVGDYAPSDFPLADVAQQDLDQIIQRALQNRKGP